MILLFIRRPIDFNKSIGFFMNIIDNSNVWCGLPRAFSRLKATLLGLENRGNASQKEEVNDRRGAYLCVFDV
ncbi:hypothetical protein FM107_07440 [Sphingobacterium sp. JB170]|nr:hypothetical protein FM107_07440 [Sphingobacterium sp. JB170]